MNKHIGHTFEGYYGIWGVIWVYKMLYDHVFISSLFYISAELQVAAGKASSVSAQ